MAWEGQIHDPTITVIGHREQVAATFPFTTVVARPSSRDRPLRAAAEVRRFQDCRLCGLQAAKAILDTPEGRCFRGTVIHGLELNTIGASQGPPDRPPPWGQRLPTTANPLT